MTRNFSNNSLHGKDQLKRQYIFIIYNNHDIRGNRISFELSHTPTDLIA